MLSAYLAQVLERQKRHEVGVMHDVGFGGALHQVAFGGVRCDDVADRVGHAALHGQRHAGKRMAQQFAALALAGLAVHVLVLQQLADVGQNRAGNDRVHVDGQGASP